MTTIRNISLAAVTLAAVATFLLGENQKGDYTPSRLGSLQQADPVRKTTDTNYEVSAYPVLGPDLAPGDGLQEVRIHCSTCHSPRYITMQPPLSAAEWEAEVKKMNRTFGAAIPEDTSQKIVAYLQAHYTAEKRQ